MILDILHALMTSYLVLNSSTLACGYWLLVSLNTAKSLPLLGGKKLLDKKVFTTIGWNIGKKKKKHYIFFANVGIQTKKGRWNKDDDVSLKVCTKAEQR